MRQDLRRNIDALLSAAADLVRDGEQLSMPAIAARAGVGASTAWRHFSSVDELMRAYTRSQVDALRSFVSAHAGEPDLLTLTIHRWVDITLQHGPALVEFRSRHGYLQRLHDNDEIITLASEAWKPGLIQALEADGVGRSALEIALYLTNSLTDPREILDLHNAAFLSADEIARKLQRVIRSSVKGWVSPP